MSEILCPCCKRPMPDQDRPDFLAEMDGLMPLDRRILDALIDAYPTTININQIVDSVYAFDPNGGPDNANNVIHVRMTHVRRTLEKTGWRITSRRDGWGSKGRYRLEKVKVRSLADA